MFARILAVNILSAFALFTGTLAGQEKKVLNLEEDWYQQYRTNLEITINLQRGKIVIVATELKNRTLIVPVIMQFDEKQQLETICWAKEAELRYDSKEHAVLM